jgi:hypothetical protein
MKMLCYKNEPGSARQFTACDRMRAQARPKCGQAFFGMSPGF